MGKRKSPMEKRISPKKGIRSSAQTKKAKKKSAPLQPELTLAQTKQKEVKAGIVLFLSRARTDKEILTKFGQRGIKALKEIAQTPPAGFRLKEGRNSYQEKTNYLERIRLSPSKEIEKHVFEVRRSENDSDYLAITFPPELDFTDDKSKNALRIFPIDSSWWGDHLCDKEAVIKLLRYLEVKPYAFAFLNGNNIGGTSYTKYTAAHIREDFRRHLAPVAHKILWAQSGPLEARMSRVDGIEPLQDVCMELGIHHTNRPIRADIYWKNPEKPIEFYAIHGRSQARKDGAKVNAIIDVVVNQNFPHFTIMGNLMEGNVNTLTVRRLDPRHFTINEYPAIAIICPGFQRFQGSEREKKGYPPPATGTVVCIITAENSHESSS